MDLKDLKLQLVNQILITQDIRILQAVQQLLALENTTDPITSDQPSSELKDLQDSIDSIFNS